MKTLIELTRLVNSFKETHQTVEKGLKTDSRYKQLYDGIISGKYSTDEEVIADLYDTAGGKKSYQKQKERYRQGITAQLLGYNLSRHFHNNYSNARYSCMSLLFASNTLTMKGNHQAAMDLMDNAASIAHKYYFTDLKIIALRKQRYMAAVTADKTTFNEYNEQLKTANEIYNAELKTEEYYQELTMHFVWKTSPLEVEKRAEEIFVEMKNIINKYDSYNVRLFYYRFAIKYYHLKNQNKKVVDICDDALNYLKKYATITPDTWVGEFTLEKMDNLILLKDYETGKICAGECLSYYKRSAYNKIVFMEYYFLLCMHTKRYKEASDIYRQVVNKTFNLNAGEVSQEKWKIFRKYLSLISNDELPGINNKEIRFDVFNCVRDKAGYNLALIIAELTSLLLTNNIDMLEARDEAFNVYVKRYITEKDYPRSYFFCKMFQSLFKNSFDHESVTKEAQVYLQLLQNSSELDHFEVMPYEQLWEIIQQKLATNEKATSHALMTG